MQCTHTQNTDASFSIQKLWCWFIVTETLKHADWEKSLKNWLISHPNWVSVWMELCMHCFYIDVCFLFTVRSQQRSHLCIHLTRTQRRQTGNYTFVIIFCFSPQIEQSFVETPASQPSPSSTAEFLKYSIPQWPYCIFIYLSLSSWDTLILVHDMFTYSYCTKTQDLFATRLLNVNYFCFSSGSAKLLNVNILSTRQLQHC